ncbi:hypothetical protein SEA_MORGANA_157 [Gordonia phage Morgana]|uniref:Uncharacterized protein n=1 Tax=Gordonia phage Morgana TaxID=3137292 RepID=A0AAX4RCS0_9CAUD
MPELNPVTTQDKVWAAIDNLTHGQIEDNVADAITYLTGQIVISHNRHICEVCQAWWPEVDTEDGPVDCDYCRANNLRQNYIDQVEEQMVNARSEIDRLTERLTQLKGE